MSELREHNVRKGLGNLRDWCEGLYNQIDNVLAQKSVSKDDVTNLYGYAAAIESEQRQLEREFK